MKCNHTSAFSNQLFAAQKQKQRAMKHHRHTRTASAPRLPRKLIGLLCGALRYTNRGYHHKSSLISIGLLVLLCSYYKISFTHPPKENDNASPTTSRMDMKEPPPSFQSLFHPSTEFSSQEWLDIQQSLTIRNKRNILSKPKILILWPTIPVLLKGSDTRCTDAIDFLSRHLGYSVDLLVWTEYAIESLDFSYDNIPDVQRLRAAGVETIFGPLDRMQLADLFSQSSFSYSIIIVWLWPDSCFLQTTLQFIQHAKQNNGHVRIISVVDDVGIASRYLIGAASSNNANPSMKKQRVQSFVLANRPLYLRGIDFYGNMTSNMDINNFSTNSLLDLSSSSIRRKGEQVSIDSINYGVALLHQEMYIYYMSDMAVGINHETTQFIKQMSPGIGLFQSLVYVSPIQPALNSKSDHQATTVMGDYNKTAATDNLLSDESSFHQRSGYLFFGYNNAANRRGLEWFIQHILPGVKHMNDKNKFHIAGTVSHPSNYNDNMKNDIIKCACSSSCISNKYNTQHIICHGSVSDKELNALIKSVKVAINPILEPSGVATKTCRALALGTPVVTTTGDGTFATLIPSLSSSGAIICDDEKCFANAINALLYSSPEVWETASAAASRFILMYYGSGMYMRNWISILQEISSKKIEIVIDATSSEEDADEQECDNALELCCDCYDDKTWIQTSKYWVLASALSQTPEFHVSVVTCNKSSFTVHPALLGVQIIDTTPNQPSPFLTGFEANILIRATSNKNNNGSSLPSYCGPSCRVVKVLTDSSNTVMTMSRMSTNVADANWLLTSKKINQEHNHPGNNIIVVRVPIAGYSSSICSGGDRSIKGDAIREQRQFSDVLKNLINEVLSKPTSRRLQKFVIPHQLKTCLVGKYLARHYISVARAVRNCPSTILFCLSVVFTAIMFLGVLFFLRNIRVSRKTRTQFRKRAE